MNKSFSLNPAIHTECINGGIEQGIMEIVGRENLKQEDQQNLDYFQSLPRNGESLFLRKLVLGIPAQASGKN